MSFHSKMVKLRKIGGYTQESFASAVGVSRQSVYKWESGASYPEVEKLLKIARLFHVTVDDMLNDELDVSFEGKMLPVAEVKAEADRRAAEAAERKARREANKAKRAAEAAAAAAKEEAAPAAEPATEEEAPVKEEPQKKRGGLFGLFRRR